MKPEKHNQQRRNNDDAWQKGYIKPSRQDRRQKNRWKKQGRK
jgi:hypothetical protein